ncbi:MAG: family 16 glycoside hydrolase [Burkholderiaceae bacterium]
MRCFATLVLRALPIATFLAAAVSPGLATELEGLKVWSFSADKVGSAPRGFEFAVTAGKRPGQWIVAEDAGNRVLAQTDRDKTARRFAMALVEGLTVGDLKLSVKAKPVAGDVEMVAGLVWRYQDADNYYVARWNSDSVRVDRVVNGERQLMTPSEIKARLPADQWHTLTVEHRGEHIKVFVDGHKLFDGRDSTYPKAGKLGVWVKADSLTYFDDLAAQELK